MEEEVVLDVCIALCVSEIKKEKSRERYVANCCEILVIIKERYEMLEKSVIEDRK